MSEPVEMSATLAADESLARRRDLGERVLFMASGEIGLPVHPALRAKLAAAAGTGAYGPVAGSAALRRAAAGYWGRRGLDVDPELVVCGPGSKALLFGMLVAIGGDVVLPVPSWVSYAAHARLLGVRTVFVPTSPGEGGVPDPALLRAAVTAARSRGRDVRSVVITLPDNPTGTVAAPATVRRLADMARDLDLVIVSDEIYRDLVFDDSPLTSPAEVAPERTVVTTGLTKSFALGGWRTGIARLPDSTAGHRLRDRLVGVASHIWSSPVAPVQEAAAYALGEPPELVAHVAASSRLHAAVAGEIAGRLAAAGAVTPPVRATCYLYPDFSRLRAPLAAAHDVHSGAALCALLLDRYGVGVLPASAFGEPEPTLRLRISVSQLYGDTDEQRNAALTATDPASLPWIAESVDRFDAVLRDLLGKSVP